MRSIPVLSALLVLILSQSMLPAQGVNTGLIKQRAKEVTGQQPKAPAPGSGSGTAGASPTSTPGSGATVAADPSLAPAIQKLVADLTVIKFRKEVTPDLNTRLAKDLALCLRTPSPAQQESVTALAGELVAALIGKSVTTDSQRQLANQLATALHDGTTPPKLSAIRESLSTMGLGTDSVASVLKHLESSVGAEILPKAK